MYITGKEMAQTGGICSRPVPGNTGYCATKDTEAKPSARQESWRSRRVYHVRNGENVRGD